MNQKWEYLFVRFDYFAGNLRPQNVDSKEVQDKYENKPLHEYANYLGEQGWEMVGFNFTPAYGYGFAVFKRMKEEVNRE
jgi:hypothetical protein